MTFLPFTQVTDTAKSIWTGPGTSLCSLSSLSLPRRPHSLFLLDHSRTRQGISLCSRPRLSLPSKGLFLVRWQFEDTGLLHPSLLLWILNLSWKLHGPLGPYGGGQYAVFSGFFVVDTFFGHFLWPLFKIFFMDTFCRYFLGTINCSAKIMVNKKHNEKPKFIILRHTSYELPGSTDTFCLMTMWGSIFCLFFYLRCIEYLHGLYQ